MNTPTLRHRVLSCLLLVPAASLFAGERRHDHDEARKAVARGERVALATLVADALRRYPGKLVEAELDGNEYEIEILRDDGRVVELEYDARNGKLRDVDVDDD
ncbi:MAG TPA: PepSY domain-containing protein [Patescibacteria group bacterium]|nr:PepSY domain-containing protein [Patescibacteria group bacterium]